MGCYLAVKVAGASARGGAHEHPALDPMDQIPPPPDPTTIPGFLDAIPAPPQQVQGQRVLRVFINETTMEGQIPDYRVGQSIRLGLGFNSGTTPPVGELLTTRRGVVHPHHQAPYIDGEQASWQALWRGDGWAATLYSAIPAHRDEVLTGYFFDAALSAVEYPTDLKITRIFAQIGHWGRFESPHRFWQEVTTTGDCHHDLEGWRVRSIVLDVTLDEVSPPPLPCRAFRDKSVAVDDTRLWVLERELPVARSFCLVDGVFLSEVLIPVPVLPLGELRLQTVPGYGAVVVGPTGSFLLGEENLAHPLDHDPGQLSTTRATPSSDAPPSGWTTPRRLDDGLIALTRLDPETGVFEYAVAVAQPEGELRWCRLETHGHRLREGFRFGEGYLVTSHQGLQFHLDRELNLLRMDPALTDIPRYESRTTVIVATDETEIRFFNKHTAEHLTTAAIPRGQHLAVAEATSERIVVVVHAHPGYHQDGRDHVDIRTWRPDTGWHLATLHGAPSELFTGTPSS